MFAELDLRLRRYGVDKMLVHSCADPEGDRGSGPQWKITKI